MARKRGPESDPSKLNFLASLRSTATRSAKERAGNGVPLDIVEAKKKLKPIEKSKRARRGKRVIEEPVIEEDDD